MARTEQFATAYISKYHLALVPIPRGSKGPRREGWNKPGGYFMDAEEASRYWSAHPEDGIGTVLGPSRVCSLDVDHVEHARTVLGEFGIDLDALAQEAPTVVGNPERFRVLFAAPPNLSRHALTWPARASAEKPITLLELRAGDVQDVLPPTIHPGTGKEYTWRTRPNGFFPLPPEALLTLWRDWLTFERIAKSLCPWAPAPTLALRVRHDESVMATYNARHSVSELLERHSYKRQGRRFVAPSSESGLAGVVILDDGRCFSHHAADPLADGHAHDAFDVFRILEHGGDAKRAAAAAAQEFGFPRADAPRLDPAVQVPMRDPEAPSDDWPEPKGLPDGLPPVEAFDFDLLPATLRPWAEDICERVQCPPDFVGVTIMAALGAVLGRKLGIRPQEHTDWTSVPNQWALVVGRPGVLKSPAMEAALSPLKRLAARAVEDHKAEMIDYAQKAKLAKLRAEAGEKVARTKLAKNPTADVTADLVSDEPEEPTLRRYIANDTSAAALGELLRRNPNGLLVFRDELVSLLKSLDREDNAEGRGFYLTGWNGDSAYTFDRIGRGLNLHIPAVCLSVLGSTQPGRIGEYIRAAVRGGMGDDGLMQRFGLLVWPDNSQDWRDVDRWPDSEARRRANDIFETLDGLDPLRIGAEQDEHDNIPFLRFAAEALAEFRRWRGDLEPKIRGGELHPALEAHLAKYRKLVPGLALIVHLADGGTGPVGARPTLQALAWAEYLESHARRAYASVMAGEVTSAKAILDKLRRGELPSSFAARDVYRKGWAHLSDREQVVDALQLLADLDYLAAHTLDTGGRPLTHYVANPRGLAT
jgi:hypothetical protein